VKDTGKVYDMLVLELRGHAALTWLYFYIWLFLVAKVSILQYVKGTSGKRKQRAIRRLSGHHDLIKFLCIKVVLF
jgi:hypothetical protein